VLKGRNEEIEDEDSAEDVSKFLNDQLTEEKQTFFDIILDKLEG